MISTVEKYTDEALGPVYLSKAYKTVLRCPSLSTLLSLPFGNAPTSGLCLPKLWKLHFNIPLEQGTET